MAKFRLSTDHAAANGGYYTIKYHLDGRPDPFPKREFEARTTAEAMAARQAYVEEVQTTGVPAAVSLRLIEGRSPNGFKKANVPYHVTVNL